MSTQEKELIDLENDSEVVELREIEQENELINLENKNSEVMEPKEIEVICLSSDDSNSAHNERTQTSHLNKSQKKYRKSSSNSSLNANSLRKHLREERRSEKTCQEEAIARYKESYREKVMLTRFHDPTKESREESALDYHRGHFSGGNFQSDNYGPGINNDQWDSYGYNDENQRPICHDTWVSWASLYERGCNYDWGRDCYNDWGRDRDNDRGADRDNDWGRDYDWSHSWERSRDMPYNSDEERRDWEHEGTISCEQGLCENSPNNTLILQGLDVTLTENEIREEILHYGLEPKIIRLIRKETGASRGFAFVEFQLLSEAVRWKELTKGVVVFRGNNRARLDYSIPKGLLGPEGCILNKADWNCPKCGMSNFNWRDDCLQCNSAREDSCKFQQGDHYNEISNNPSNITVSSDEKSLASQNSFGSSNAAFVALDAAQQTNQKQDHSYNQYYGVTAGYSGTCSALDNTQYLTMGSSVLNQVQIVSLGTVIVGGVTYYKYPLPDISTYHYDITSGYYYDPETGLYYDANSQYYYNSQIQSYLYWDGERQTYLPVSSSTREYVSRQLAIWRPPTSVPQGPPTCAPQANSDAAAATESENPKKGKDGKEKLDKAKIAKKIAKDLEKWAKTLNRKRKLGVVACPAVEVSPNVFMNNDIAKPSAAANAGFATLQKKTTLVEKNTLMAEIEKKLMANDIARPSAVDNAGIAIFEKGTTLVEKNSPMAELGTKLMNNDIARPFAEANVGFATLEKRTPLAKWNARLVKLVAKRNALEAKLAKKCLNSDIASPSAVATSFPILEKGTTLADRNVPLAELDTKLNATATKTILVSYEDDSNSDTEPDSPQPGVKISQSSKVDVSQFIDLSKMACLLCKRQFPNKDALTRHQQLSDLHKKNLAQTFGNV